MSAQHTPGRIALLVGYDGSLQIAAHRPLRINLTTSGTPVIADVCRHEDAEHFSGKENARRLVACWNALEDLPQEALDGGWSRAGLEAYGKRMEAQRDELIVALREIAEASFDPDVVQCARAAIAKAEGGAA